MIVETKRLILREIAVEDAAFVLRLVNEPSFVSNNFGRQPWLNQSAQKVGNGFRKNRQDV